MDLIGPYLTSEINGIGGQIKLSEEDFFVEEIPAYEPCGEGEHLFLFIEKKRTSTPHLVRVLGSFFGVNEGRIGFAGLKDRDATTRQWISVHLPQSNRKQVAEKALEQIEEHAKRFKVLRAEWHTNKLKLGHLRGNRFVIRLRNLTVNDAQELRKRISAVAEVITKRGVPNYYGAQRFGSSKQGHRAARLFAYGRYAEALFVLFDSVLTVENSRKGEKRLELIKREKWRQVLKTLPSATLRVVLSSYQSLLFNRFLAEHLDYIDKVFEGQWAVNHSNGALFTVEDEQVEQKRADAHEISPTGPLYGVKMYWSRGVAGEWERKVFSAQDVPMVAISYPLPRNKLKGDRRALRFIPEHFNFTVMQDNSVVFEFVLPKGCYATVLLREFMKNKEADTAHNLG